mmetsp:Transcript_29747/g.78035  ORF Transcript_29747/g.78035 Transcript_29747/m.78035 type:complete len:204 (+) Transcript_29747:1146-1757(+)
MSVGRLLRGNDAQTQPMMLICAWNMVMKTQCMLAQHGVRTPSLNGGTHMSFHPLKPSTISLVPCLATITKRLVDMFGNHWNACIVYILTDSCMGTNTSVFIKRSMAHWNLTSWRHFNKAGLPWVVLIHSIMDRLDELPSNASSNTSGPTARIRGCYLHHQTKKIRTSEEKSCEHFESTCTEDLCWQLDDVFNQMRQNSKIGFF